MKHGRWQRMAAVALAICLSAGVATPANALSWSSSGSSSSWWNSWTDSWNNFWDGIFGGSEQEQGGTLTLVENETTVTEGTELRADTYALEKANSNTDLKYFDVTLYNYDDRYNQAMHQHEVDNRTYTSTWNGIYFGGNGHGANVKDEDSFQSSSGYTKASPTYNNILNQDEDSWQSTNYYYEVDGNYYPLMAKRSSDWIWGGWGYKYTYTFGYQVNGRPIQIGDAESTRNLNDKPSITVYQASSSTITLGYADYNKWTGDFGVSGQEPHGNKTYSGLVQSQLDEKNNIVFTKPDAGVFNSDSSVKDIYTNVGLPFVFEDGYYTFDANTTGAYFHTDSEQGTSRTPASNSNLYFSQTPQSHNFSAADGRTKGWFPFNDASSVTTGEEGNADYFFGMQAAIPFTMTSNGRIDPTDDSSEKISFEFSGDDDVWVFIDGKLVLDLGGVHNGMNGTINFADNTWSISAMVGQNTTPAVDVNNKALSGTLFNTERVNGVLDTDRETFAARDEHTLTVFYLERGAGSSNCKIRFNLPIKDSVSVQKQVSTVDSEGIDLTAEQMETINSVPFTFTLYHEGTPVANSNFLLYDVNGNYVRTVTTGRNGTFQLYNGQTAKFIGEIDNDDSYYVVESGLSASWQTPKWTYSAQAAGGAQETSPVTEFTSMTVTASGSNEAEDTISFVCTNTLTHVNETTIDATDDQIVVDYGLPVLIDVLANDLASDGTTKSITQISKGKYGTAEITEGGQIKYTLTKPLTDVEVLTYTAKATAANGVDTKTATATIYIIPATTMYYEENFSTNFVTFTGLWEDRGSETNPYQENDTGSSPYGSDVAYLDDSGDSNGTSKYVSTTWDENTSPSFSYTFTGTGTTFFARTTNNTAYMKVVVTDGEGNTVYQLMRDTSYKTENDETTLYNIPVFTYNAENYGTYTVTVTLARNVAEGMDYGTDFWLDGIRVYNPMNADSGEYTRATDAYARDGEANMTSATLREKLLVDYTEDSEDGSIEWIGDGFVIFTDSDGAIVKAADYQSNGPKEEVYLNDGQSVTFSLADWDRNSYDIYLGIKAPMGSGSVTINGHPLTINNTCDCYYDISNYVTMMGNVGTFEIKAIQGVISVTNIKVTGDAEFTIVGGPDIEA